MRQIAILLICSGTTEPVPVAEIAHQLGTKAKDIGEPICALVRGRQLQLRRRPGRGMHLDAMLTRHGLSFVKEVWSAAEGNGKLGGTDSTQNSMRQSVQASRRAAGRTPSIPGSLKPRMNPCEIDIHVGERIRLRRKMLGFSQSRLAAEIGVTLQRLQRIESGAKKVDAVTLVPLADKLDVPASFFFDGLSAEAKHPSIPTNDPVPVQDVGQMRAGPNNLRLPG